MRTAQGSCWILTHGVLILAGAVTPAAVAGSVLYVDDDAPGGGDGSSWDTSFGFLQDALVSAAQSGTVSEIRVAQGTYVPDRSEASPGGTGDRARTFNLLSGVSILGGYAGPGAGDPDARDIVQFTTVLSGDLGGNDGPPGSFTSNGENSRNVVTGDGTDPSAVLDGFTLTGGNANGPDDEDSLHLARGGGIWNGTGSPTVRDCRIEYNTALLRGGGMYNYTDTSPVVTGCTFRGNFTSWSGHGGGLRNFQCDATVAGCQFIDNSSGTGGGVDTTEGSAVVTGCVFTGNSSFFGGGLSSHAATTTVTGCTFIGNLAGNGGGIDLVGSATTVTGSTFCDNSPNHIDGTWTDAGGNSFCPLCDPSSGLALEVPAAYPTIQSAINAACDGAEVIVSPGTYVERISFAGKDIIVRSTDGPAVTTIDAERTGPVVLLINGEVASTTLDGFTLANGVSEYGGGAWLLDGSAAIIDCRFKDNEADIGGAIRHDSNVGGRLDLLRCEFDGNQAYTAAGAISSVSGDALSAVDCVFTDNDGGLAAGAVASSGSPTSYVNCLFARNSASFVGGGVAAGEDANLVNCAFSRNAAASSGGGLEAAIGGGGAIRNCTFSQNQGGGTGASPPLSNCILWGNTPVQIMVPSVVVDHSDVQGGWPGTGNIDADPLFIQPGADNVRLSLGSPCVDAGNNAALPVDAFDLDGDGDSDEAIPFDLDGGPRVLGAAVDMGAYEGEGEPLPPAAGVEDLDEGGFAFLIPDGATFDPMQSSAALVFNTSGGDNASFMVTQHATALHPGAGGYSELNFIMASQTSLSDGEFFLRVYIPFTAGELGGADPLHTDLTTFNPQPQGWALAVAGNTVASPGHAGPIGDRIAVDGPGDWGVTFDLGDYGVYWNPDTQSGFAWANLDCAGDVALGSALCPADCLQPPNGFVGALDLMVMLDAVSGTTGFGACDINYDGSVNDQDLQALVDHWGLCPSGIGYDHEAQPVQTGPGPQEELPDIARSVRAQQSTRSADLDASGAVDRNDVLLLQNAWGPCAGCRADLDGDGRVGVRDLLAQLRGWTAQSPSRFAP